MRFRTLLSLGAVGLCGALVHGTAGAQRVQCGTRTSAPCSASGTYLSISAGRSHSCGVRQDGTAWCWGEGYEGALGIGKRGIAQMPQRVRGSTLFVDVHAGGGFSCARAVDESVYCWGLSEAVPGWPEMQLQPIRIRLEGVARSLTTGGRHACLLDAEGRASCWGFNVDGETGTGSGGVGAALIAHPTPVATETRFTMLSAGMGFTCGVSTEGALLCWGSNIDGIQVAGTSEQCGDVVPIPCNTRPVEVPIPERAVQVSSGSSHACAMTASGNLYCWGSNGFAQVGAYNSAVPHVRVPSRVTAAGAGAFTSVSSGGIHTCALSQSRKLYCWGSDMLSLAEEIEPEAVAPRVAAAGTQFRAISLGSQHSCGLDTRGRLLCWGDTIRGALGKR